MARIVIKDAKEPMMVGDKAICMCGLSTDQPFCQGKHKKTTDEKDDTLYQYDDEGNRFEVGHICDEDGECCGGDECGCSKEECDCGKGECDCHSKESSNKVAKKKKK